MKKGLIIGLVAVLVVAGVAFAAMRVLNPPSEDAAVSLVPEDAYLYANLFIKPSGDQKRALDELLVKFPKIESTEQAIDRVTGLLDDELKEIGLTYAEDVEPWLGDQISFFLSGEEIDPPDVAGLLETTDPDAAADAIDKIRESEDAPEPEQKSYEGIDYELESGEGDDPVAIGFVEDFLVVGTESGFKAVVDASEDDGGLTETEDFQEAFDGLDEDGILSVYVDQTRLFELLEESGDLGAQEKAAFNAFPGLSDAGTAGLVLSARSDGVAFQTSSSVPADEAFGSLTGLYAGTDLIRELPGDSWAALGVPDLGATVTGFIDTISTMPGAEGAAEQVSATVKRETGLDLEEDILSWMGDAALFVQGTNLQEIGGGLIVESNDPEATKNALDKLRDRIEREQVPTTDQSRGDYEGFSIQARLPAPIYALAGDRFIVTYGENATDGAIEPDETLAEDETFQAASDALGDGSTPSFYADLDAVFELVEFAQAFSGQTDPTYEQDVKPWTDPLSFVVAGSREEDDRLFQTIFVGVEGESS